MRRKLVFERNFLKFNTYNLYDTRHLSIPLRNIHQTCPLIFVLKIKYLNQFIKMSTKHYQCFSDYFYNFHNFHFPQSFYFQRSHTLYN